MSLSSHHYDRPTDDTVEVSVFGTGRGECIIVHLKNDEWIVVDSCRHAQTKRAIALEYLEEIGVTVATALKHIIATHWDDDHILGMGELFCMAKAATFHCSAALTPDLLETILVTWGGNDFLHGGTLVEDLKSILTELGDRSTSAFPCPNFIGMNVLIWSRGERDKIIGLAPSSSAVTATRVRLLKKAEDQKDQWLRIPNIQPNDSSVVLAIKLDSASILLGGDLERRADASLGWNPIVKSHADGKVFDLFKIPHHGSETAYQPDVWEKLLVNNVHAAVTPYSSSQIPGTAECLRILSLTKRAYLAASASSPRPNHPKKDVLRALKQQRSASEIRERYGHIRFRKSSSSTEWVVDLFGEGTKIE